MKMAKVIIATAVVLMTVAAAATHEPAQVWWEYTNAHFGIRLVYPAHWVIHERSSNDRLSVTIGPNREDPPIWLRIFPKAEAARENFVFSYRDTKITTINVAGQPVQQATYYLERVGYRKLVMLTNGDRTVMFGCHLDEPVQSEQAFERLLKSFRFIARPTRR
jgi:FMN phosphatase YigB (HAD superfamily)